ncbi:MAG: hypothetical protein WAO76_05055 [Georgfuchsia sp.]
MFRQDCNTALDAVGRYLLAPIYSGRFLTLIAIIDIGVIDLSEAVLPVKNRAG